MHDAYPLFDLYLGYTLPAHECLRSVLITFGDASELTLVGRMGGRSTSTSELPLPPSNAAP